jgi:hypothetical protein
MIARQALDPFPHPSEAVLDLDSTCLSCSLFLNDSEEMKTVATLATREMADSRYNKE